MLVSAAAAHTGILDMLVCAAIFLFFLNLICNWWLNYLVYCCCIKLKADTHQSTLNSYYVLLSEGMSVKYFAGCDWSNGKDLARFLAKVDQ